jgi:hypothetical protein
LASRQKYRGLVEIGRQTNIADRQRNRRTDREMNGHTAGQTDTNRQKGRRTDRCRDNRQKGGTKVRHMERQTET